MALVCVSTTRKGGSLLFDTDSREKLVFLILGLGEWCGFARAYIQNRQRPITTKLVELDLDKEQHKESGVPSSKKVFFVLNPKKVRDIVTMMSI